MINRPQPDEYSAFASRYVNLVGNEPILEILENQRDFTVDLFKTIDADKALHSYADGKWTIKQVLGHVIDTERIHGYRSLAFSHEAIELPGFDQDVYMANATFNLRTLEDLIGEYKTVRESTLYLFRSMSQEQLTRKGIASGSPVSVRAFAYMIAGHELHHINILKERYL